MFYIIVFELFWMIKKTTIKHWDLKFRCKRRGGYFWWSFTDKTQLFCKWWSLPIFVINYLKQRSILQTVRIFNIQTCPVEKCHKSMFKLAHLDNSRDWLSRDTIDRNIIHYACAIIWPGLIGICNNKPASIWFTTSSYIFWRNNITHLDLNNST